MLGTFFNVSTDNVSEMTGFMSGAFGDIMPLLLIIFAVPIGLAIIKVIISLTYGRIQISIGKKRIEKKQIEYLKELESSFRGWLVSKDIKPETVKGLKLPERIKLFKEFVKEREFCEAEKITLPFFDIPVKIPTKKLEKLKK